MDLTKEVASRFLGGQLGVEKNGTEWRGAIKKIDLLPKQVVVESDWAAVKGFDGKWRRNNEEQVFAFRYGEYGEIHVVDYGLFAFDEMFSNKIVFYLPTTNRLLRKDEVIGF